MNEVNDKIIAVHEVKIDLLIRQQAELARMLDDFFKAGGICETSRSNTQKVTAQIRNIYWILGITIPATLGMLVKLAFFR